MGDKQESLWKDLTSLIPGYGAYRDQESRRDDDRRTRDFLRGRLQDCKRSLDKLGERAVANADWQAPLEIEKFRSQLDLAQSRISAAVEGYSGWFNRRKVDVELLDKVAQLDANLVSLVDQIDATIKAAILDDSPLKASDLPATLDLLHARMDRRHELLKSGS